MEDWWLGEWKHLGIYDKYRWQGNSGPTTTLLLSIASAASGKTQFLFPMLICSGLVCTSSPIISWSKMIRYVKQTRSEDFVGAFAAYLILFHLLDSVQERLQRCSEAKKVDRNVYERWWPHNWSQDAVESLGTWMTHWEDWEASFSINNLSEQGHIISISWTDVKIVQDETLSILILCICDTFTDPGHCCARRFWGPLHRRWRLSRCNRSQDHPQDAIGDCHCRRAKYSSCMQGSIQVKSQKDRIKTDTNKNVRALDILVRSMYGGLCCTYFYMDTNASM